MYRSYQHVSTFILPFFSVLLSKVDYIPGGANTEFAARYRHLVGVKIPTVSEAFANFTKELRYAINPLYRQWITEMVGTTHLIVVNARFERNAVWSLGICCMLDMILRNYPERDVAEKIASALFKSMNLQEDTVRQEAKQLEDWARDKTRDDIETALQGKGDSIVAQVARKQKEDKYWLYSCYFGIGLLRLMEIVGIEMKGEEVHPIMEDWIEHKMGRDSSNRPCNDTDSFLELKQKLAMMETMMQEVAIREKKRTADRLERKAEDLLRLAQREKEFQEELDREAAASSTEEKED